MVDDLVGGVGELDQHLVRSGNQVLYDQGFAARIGPMPRRIVDRDVDVPDARGDIEGPGSENRDDAQILRSGIGSRPGRGPEPPAPVGPR